MSGKRYEAKDKRVQKMSRDGLTEENLHSGEHRRISSRVQDAPLVQENSNAPIRLTRDNGQTHASQGKRQRFNPYAQDGVNIPQADVGTYPVQQDAGQPSITSSQNMERHFSAYARLEHPPSEIAGQDAFTAEGTRTPEQGANDVTKNLGTQAEGVKQKISHPLRPSAAQPAAAFDLVQSSPENRTTNGTENAGGKDASEPPTQQKQAFYRYTHVQPETAPEQQVTFGPTAQDTDSESTKQTSDQKAPEDNNLTEQVPVAKSDEGRFATQSARMGGVRETSTGRAAVQTVVEMRYRRQKKQVQEGYRKYHAEDGNKESTESATGKTDFQPDEGDAGETAQQEPKQRHPAADPAEHSASDANPANPASGPKSRMEDNPYQAAFHQDEPKSTGNAETGSDKNLGQTAQKHRAAQERPKKGGGAGDKKSDGFTGRENRQWKATKNRENQKQEGRQNGQRQNKPNFQDELGKKKSSRLSFDDEENGMVRGAGMGIGRKAASAAANTVTGYVHTKVHGVERENSAVEGAHKAEIVGENSIHKAVSRVSQRHKKKSGHRKEAATQKKGSRIQFSPSETAETAGNTGEKAAQASAAKKATKDTQAKKLILNRFWQKKRYKEAYAAARNGKAASGAAAKATQTAGSKVKSTIQTIFRKNKGILIGVGAIALFVLIFGAILSSCTAMMQGTQNTFVSSTYPSEDSDIHAAENAYLELESKLNDQINNMESTHPGYDEYNYQIDEISHNPYQLISYLTAKFEEFTYGQVAGEVQSLFNQQYELIVDEVIEIRTRTVTDPETGEETEEEYEYRILNITLINHGFDSVARSNMDSDQTGRYTLYNTTYGNRSYLFDTATLPTYTGDNGEFGYEIPAEALTDESFARMIAEAEKYLGYPYVWGGSSPSTSFDCSGFVCWVINNCGNGWNVGRTTANGLRSYCAYVSPEEAKPGDLIFFQGTYNTTGASHVGIYVGNGMMIHCGDPIQYTSVQTSYWQSHFMAYGRIQ